MGQVRLGPSSAFVEGEPVIARVAGHSLFLARVAGVVHAVANVCGHQTRAMDGGRVFVSGSGEPCVECPHHAMCFDLRDGHVVDAAGHLEMDPVRAFAVEEKDGMVFVELPD